MTHTRDIYCERDSVSPLICYSRYRGISNVRSLCFSNIRFVFYVRVKINTIYDIFRICIITLSLLNIFQLTFQLSFSGRHLHRKLPLDFLLLLSRWPVRVPSIKVLLSFSLLGVHTFQSKWWLLRSIVTQSQRTVTVTHSLLSILSNSCNVPQIQNTINNLTFREIYEIHLSLW